MDLVCKPIVDDVLNEHFTNVFRSGYISVKGTTLTDNYQKIRADIDNFLVYDDDIWICSLPKTGTTWTQEMIWMIVNGFDFKEAQKCITERFPFLEYVGEEIRSSRNSILFLVTRSYLTTKNVYEKYSEFNPPKQFANAISFVSKQKRPRLIKTHLPWDLLPKDICDGRKHPKIVYITRNPIDTCVSYFHHCKLIEGYRGNFTEFSNLYLSGKLCYTPYWNNVLQYWNRRNESNVLFLKFEDLKKDLPNTIRNVAKFLSKKVTEEEIQLLSHHLSFENMKKNKSVNYEEFVQFHKKYKLVNCEGSFIRSGKVGEKCSEVTQSIKEQFDLWIQQHAPNNELGY